MSGTIPPSSREPQSGVWAWYERTPLYLRIVVALLIGVGVGFLMGPDAHVFKPLSDIVLRLLGALATPLIFFALLHALLTAKIHRAALNVSALREAVARAMKISDETADRVLQARTSLEAGRACIELDPDLALSILERGLVRAREADALAIEALLAGDIASIQIRRGFPMEALRGSEQEAEAIGKAGLVRGDLRNRLRLARCFDLLGDLKKAADTLESETAFDADASSGAGFLSYRCRIKLEQGRVSSASEDANAAVRLTGRAGGLDLADALLHRGRCALARAEVDTAAADFEAAQTALDSVRGVRRQFNHALLGLAHSELLILKGDFHGGAESSETVAATFDRGWHEIWAATARLMAARCLSMKDATAADRL